MIGERLDIIYGLKALSALDIWKIIFEYLQKQNTPFDTKVEFSDNKMALSDVAGFIEKSKSVHFHVEFDGFSFDYGTVASKEHDLIVIKDKVEFARLNWQKLVNAFFNKAPFIQAWVSNIEYNYWQNAIDPLQYDALGKSYEGLPMKSNGLPFPLEQMNIDISNNPCRRILCDGYVEAIGAQMWFSKKIEKIANISLSNITVDGCQIEEQGGLYHIDCGMGVFKDESTNELQKQLRSALYST